jgi:hypothetical protein
VKDWHYLYVELPSIDSMTSSINLIFIVLLLNFSSNPLCLDDFTIDAINKIQVHPYKNPPTNKIDFVFLELPLNHL